jgi:putative SOS response-associated peptidase YedK
MALAGLWENWSSPTGEWVRSFAIVTRPPNALCAELHNRMPVVLAPESWPLWLGEELASPAERITRWPISARVGNVKNNDPSLIDPIAA